MMSFDEFHAVQKRMRARKQRQQQQQQQQAGKEQPTDSNKAKKSGENAENEEEEEVEAGFTIGAFLEMQETQTAVILVVLLDILAAIAQLILQSRGMTQTDTTAQWLLHNVLQSFNSFTLFFYALELLATFVAFGLGTLAHFGYTFDTILLIGVIVAQTHGFGTECRLLGIYRIWRVARLVTYLVDQEKAAHAETHGRLQQKEEELLANKATIVRLEAEVRSEQDARRAVESTLRQYKDEVDLLHEALQQAARDVASAGLEAELEEDEALEEDEVEEEAKGAVERTSRKPDAEKSAETDASAAKKRTPRRAPTTVIVHEDGTFEKR